MDLKEAKSIIIAYLTGKRGAQRQVLEEACEAAWKDPEFRRFIQEEFHQESDRDLHCQGFRVQLAEFSELSPEEREERMPERVAHVKACPECRKAYREMVPLWSRKTVEERIGQAAETVSILNEKIRLVIRKTGRLIDEGLLSVSEMIDRGPAEEDQEEPDDRSPSMLDSLGDMFSGALPVLGGFGIAVDISDESSEGLAYTFEDAELESVFQLNLDRTSSGTVRVRLKMDPLPKGVESGSAVLAEVESESGERCSPGSLDEIAAEGVELVPGNWRIVLHLQIESRDYKWILPVNLTTEGENTTSGSQNQ